MRFYVSDELPVLATRTYLRQDPIASLYILMYSGIVLCGSFLSSPFANDIFALAQVHGHLGKNGQNMAIYEVGIV
jgi:hypothetical protein